MIFLKLIIFLLIYSFIDDFFLDDFLDDFQAQGRDGCGAGSSFAGKAVAAGRRGVPGRIGSTSKRRQCFYPIFQKKNGSNIAGFRNFPKKSSNIQQQFPFSIHFPCFIMSSFNVASVFQVVASGAAGGKGGGTDPGHCLVEAGIKRWDQKIWWMG